MHSYLGKDVKQQNPIVEIDKLLPLATLANLVYELLQ